MSGTTHGAQSSFIPGWYSFEASPGPLQFRGIMHMCCVSLTHCSPADRPCSPADRPLPVLVAPHDVVRSCLRPCHASCTPLLVHAKAACLGRGWPQSCVARNKAPSSKPLPPPPHHSSAALDSGCMSEATGRSRLLCGVLIQGKLCALLTRLRAMSSAPVAAARQQPRGSSKSKCTACVPCPRSALCAYALPPACVGRNAEALQPVLEKLQPILLVTDGPINHLLCEQHTRRLRGQALRFALSLLHLALTPPHSVLTPCCVSWPQGASRGNAIKVMEVFYPDY